MKENPKKKEGLQWIREGLGKKKLCGELIIVCSVIFLLMKPIDLNLSGSKLEQSDGIKVNTCNTWLATGPLRL